MNSRSVGRPMEVLLVEDSLTDAALAIGALRNGSISHRMTLVRDGEEALEFLRHEGRFARAPRPDLLLLDLHLPKMSGLELLAEIRGQLDLQDIPVVILTGSQTEEDRLRCEMLNVESYITKPVNFDKFVNVVKLLRKHLLADVLLPASISS